MERELQLLDLGTRRAPRAQGRGGFADGFRQGQDAGFERVHGLPVFPPRKGSGIAGTGSAAPSGRGKRIPGVTMITSSVFDFVRSRLRKNAPRSGRFARPGTRERFSV